MTITELIVSVRKNRQVSETELLMARLLEIYERYAKLEIDRAVCTHRCNPNSPQRWGGRDDCAG